MPVEGPGAVTRGWRCVLGGFGRPGYSVFWPSEGNCLWGPRALACQRVCGAGGCAAVAVFRTMRLLGYHIFNAICPQRLLSSVLKAM